MIRPNRSLSVVSADNEEITGRDHQEAVFLDAGVFRTGKKTTILLQMPPATVLGQQTRIRKIPVVTVYTMTAIVWGIKGGNFLLPSAWMLLLPLMVLQPPLIPPEIGDHCERCKHNNERHRVLHDHCKNPAIHLDIGGNGGF